jgi:serine/threonine-protein kinase
MCIVEALMYLDSYDLVHCDIFPSNIFISDLHADVVNGIRAKLGDFGSTSTLPHTCNSGELGHRGWMAPEFEDHFLINKTTDIFSLGKLIYFLLTGTSRFIIILLSLDQALWREISPLDLRHSNLD